MRTWLFLFFAEGSEMMNISGTIKKLQKAILHNGLAIAINRSQFYSDDKRCFIPIISLTTRIAYYSEKKEEWKEKNYEIIRTTSQIDALECLVDIYKAVST